VAHTGARLDPCCVPVACGSPRAPRGRWHARGDAEFMVAFLEPAALPDAAHKGLDGRGSCRKGAQHFNAGAVLVYAVCTHHISGLCFPSGCKITMRKICPKKGALQGEAAHARYIHLGKAVRKEKKRRSQQDLQKEGDPEGTQHDLPSSPCRGKCATIPREACAATNSARRQEDEGGLRRPQHARPKRLGRGR
jgi:hypothetical protein